jgi:hypothetical protein
MGGFDVRLSLSSDAGARQPTGVGVCAWPECPALPTVGRYCPVHAPQEVEDVTESKRTRASLGEVQRRWPTAVIYKHNDRTTKGIPDVQIVHAKSNIWMEMKDADTESVESLMATPRGKLQHHELKRLAREGAIALVVVFRAKRTCIHDGVSLDLITDRFSLAEFLTQ